MDGGIFSSPTGATQTSLALIFEVKPEDIMTAFAGSPSGLACKIQVKNHTSFAPLIQLNGTSGAGSASPDVVASLTIFKLA
jgi:hypothetical protein